MEIVLYILGGIAGLIIIFIVYRYWTTIKATQKRDRDIFEKVKPVIDTFDNGLEPNKELIQKLAEDDASRGALYSILKNQDRTAIFPNKYKNFLSSAEASLVFWLLHPNELGNRPDYIEFVKTVQKEQEMKGQIRTLDYYVFKFKMEEPHWAAKDGWMVGVAGPYLDDSEPYDFAPGTFSTFEKFASKSPKEHVNWVHDTMNKKGQY